MTSHRTLFQDEVSLRALGLIQDNHRISQRDIDAQVGISVGAARGHLATLAEKGQIKVGNFQASTNKRAYIYPADARADRRQGLPDGRLPEAQDHQVRDAKLRDRGTGESSGRGSGR